VALVIPNYMKGGWSYMEKRKIGILTFSDGRESVHRELEALNLEFQGKLASALEATGEVTPISGRETIWTAELAKNEATRLRSEGCELTIFNFAVWSFPHLAAIASKFAPGPFLLFSNINPQYPGMVGMLSLQREPSIRSERCMVASPVISRMKTFSARSWLSSVPVLPLPV